MRGAIQRLLMVTSLQESDHFSGLDSRTPTLSQVSLCGHPDMEGVFVAQSVFVATLPLAQRVFVTHQSRMPCAIGIELVCLTSIGPTRFFVLCATDLVVKTCGCTVHFAGSFSGKCNPLIVEICKDVIITVRIIWSILNLQRVLGQRMRDSHVCPATTVRIDKQAVRYWAHKNGQEPLNVFVDRNTYIHTKTRIYSTTNLPSVATKGP